VLVLGSLGALLATGIGSIPTTHATPATTSALEALRARRAALIAELAAMQPSIDVAGSAVSGAEAAYEAQQQQVLSEQARLNALNAQLAALGGQETSDQNTIADNKTALASLIRATFESTGNDQVLAALLSANSFSQAMDLLGAANQVSRQVSDLISQLASQEAAIRSDEARIRIAFTQASALEGDLADDSSRLLSDLMNRNDVFNTLRGPARLIAAEIATIDEEIADDEAGSPVGSGSCRYDFAYGECTWYVAQRRCIPWGGNADQWYYNAAAMGFKEGHMPVAGAVVVFWPGGDGASRVGHVAYVEAVGPADGIPQGEFKFSEMNALAGWDRVDYRVLPNNSSGIQGFIYDR
jgi:surface antigen/peptidoglycan hydrolase CwlO-like protein